jgi:Family of unknown function (DUF6114)
VGSGKRTRGARGIIVRDWLSYTTASVKTLALGPERKMRSTPPGPRQGRFKRWRRSRPFWGGLLLFLAGGELVLIPLGSLLIHGGVKLVIYIGIGGVFGVLIGLLLITAGLLLWISPAHKTFYALAGVILAVLSFIASNLGGFFIGMLLGIIGGALAFAWTPDPAAEADTTPLRPLTEEVAPDATALDARALDDTPPNWPVPDGAGLNGVGLNGIGLNEAGPAEGTSGDEGEDAPGGRYRSGGRLLAGAAMPVLLASSLLTAHTAVQRPAAPQAASGCILWVICFPSSTPSPSPSPTPSPGSASPAGNPAGLPAASPSPSGSVQPDPVPGAGSSAGAGPGAGSSGVIARDDMGLEASTATTVLTAGTATLNGLAYQGTAKVPVASGGTQTMMVFTLNSMILSGNVTTTVTEDGQTTVTAASTLDFSGGITLYATKLSGTLLGVPTTLTPDSVLTVLLHLLNTVTPLVPLTMTNVTTDQPLVMAGGLQAANLSVTS